MTRRVLNLEKVTLSLPRELVQYANRRAQDLATSRSYVIGVALAQARDRNEAELAREGYAFYSREAADFAAGSIVAISSSWTTPVGLG